jgi:hypothetical protein
MKQMANLRWMILRTKVSARMIVINADRFQPTAMTQRGHNEQ